MKSQELITLELQHRLVRQAINIAVSKAMEDMKSSTKRSTRNLVDLGLLYAKTEAQKNFFGIAKKIISSPQTPYHVLISSMITNVNNDTIRKVGLNLGYSSLIHGARKLKKRWKSTGDLAPWLIIFDRSEPDPDFFPNMDRCIQELRELGIYSYIVCLHDTGDVSRLCDIVERYDECMFALKVPPDVITEETADIVGRRNNMIVSVQAEGSDLQWKGRGTAFHLLRCNRCLYGFHVNYNDKTMIPAVAPEYVRSAIDSGCFFGIYVAEEGVSDECRKSVYHFARSTRGENGRPLLTMEWYRDIHDITKAILSGEGYRKVDLSARKTNQVYLSTT